ncbi:class I SAM-dependent methyltransferase [Actinomadura atramentaria]|uniref:class I SAM-dependent methyltransferase n=1 Tax=Actinomadura atramentaria TaxID=1990 RepID=UPI0012F92FDA|nr:methyltransferase domain-containing protein [Actinomadura atramentaria]
MDTIEIQRPVRATAEHWWHRERRMLLARTAERFVARRALHLGGACDARVLADRGWDVVAIDSSGTRVDTARCAGLDARLGDPCALPLDDEEFHFVSALDILPTKNDRAAISEIARVLLPDGIAFLTVSTRHHDRRSITALARSVGLRVERVRYRNVLLGGALRRRPGLLTKALPTHINRRIAHLSALERRLPLGAVPGGTLVALVRKPL